jgi:hypothetical protein
MKPKGINLANQFLQSAKLDIERKAPAPSGLSLFKI